MFTCAATRNGNLELSSSMDSIKVIHYLKQFLSRRGYVNMFISGNFSSFKSNEVAIILLVNYINWKYVYSLFPWRGGFCESELQKVPFENPPRKRNEKEEEKTHVLV